MSEHVVEGGTAALERSKAVISRLEPVEGHGTPDPAGGPGEHGLGRQRIPGAADEQDRTADAGKVLVASPLGLPHRLERVAEQEQPEGRERVVGGAGHDRADPAAHRPPPQHEPLGREAGATGEERRRLSGGGLEDGRAIGRPPTGAAIRVVESERRDARIRERVGDRDQRRRRAAGAGAVRQQDGAIGARARTLELALEVRRRRHVGHGRRSPGGGAQPAGK